LLPPYESIEYYDIGAAALPFFYSNIPIHTTSNENDELLNTEDTCTNLDSIVKNWMKE